MELNTIGFVAAVSTFFGVWFGHVAVRKIESISPGIWLPAMLFFLAGMLSEWLALLSSNTLLSSGFGILGFTFFWDAIEFFRHQNRIKKGHAPANPANPRHARLLRESSNATTLDVLKRDPIGRQVSQTEAIQLITDRSSPMTNY
jgi:hypothetical protein